MLNPIVTDYILVRTLGNKEYAVTAKTDIPNNTIVEICPILVLTKRDAILLAKSIPTLADKIIVDQEILKREYQVFLQLGELELEKRLDEGQITASEYRKILMSKLNPDALLSSHSHMLMLGNGLLYNISDTPNLVCEYHSAYRVCVFKTVRSIHKGSELTYYRQ